jgi:type II secretory pathway pseudopilin PulG
MHTRNEAQNALLLTAFALRAYRLEHNSYPNSLKELTPRYLSKIPSDPFADNKPLQYRRLGSEYSLYSIGPDCIDNNGRAIDSKIPVKTAYDKRRRYLVEQDSKGDIVAGLNIG